MVNPVTESIFTDSFAVVAGLNVNVRVAGSFARIDDNTAEELTFAVRNSQKTSTPEAIEHALLLQPLNASTAFNTPESVSPPANITSLALSSDAPAKL